MKSSVSSFGDAGKDSADRETRVVEIAAPADLVNQIKVSASAGVESSLEDYIGRPQLIASGTFASTDGPLTFAEFSPFYVLFSNSMIYNKCLGKMLLKGTLCMKLQVNATPFQQGRYILAHIHSGGSLDLSTTEGFWNRLHRSDKCQITQLPHAEIEIGVDSEVTLKVPYVNMELGYSIPGSLTGHKIGDIGKSFIYPYSPISSAAGALTCSYSLWIWLEDVEMTGVAMYQAGGDTSDVERKSVNKGPIESTLIKVSKSMGVLSEIPLLSAFAKPTSWVSDVLARSAKVWGWSAPLDESPITRVAEFSMPYNACSDAVSPAMPLSLHSTNSLMQMTGIGKTDYDELSIDFIKSKFSYFGSGSLSTSGGINTVIMSGTVQPSAYQFSHSVGTDVWYTYTPVAYLAEFFDCWRGGLRYKFKFVKTKFHSGRVMFVYTHVTASDPLSPSFTVAASAYGLREIWDLSESSEFEVTVPYQATTPYLNLDEGSGRWALIVLDPLVAPSTVSSTISVLGEVAGADDLEFAFPVNMEDKVLVAPDPASYQMGGEEYVGNSKELPSGVISSAACMGEKISSLRSLLKRYSTCYARADEVASVNAWRIRPWFYEVRIDLADTNEAADLYTCIVPCFAVARGGMRVRVLGQWVSKSCVTSLYSPVDFDVVKEPVSPLVTTLIDYLTLKANTPTQPFILDTNTGPDVQIPYYEKSYVHSNAQLILNRSNITGNNVDKGFVPRGVLDIVLPSSEPLFIVRRAVADDFNAACFVSVPCFAKFSVKPSN